MHLDMLFHEQTKLILHHLMKAYRDNHFNALVDSNVSNYYSIACSLLGNDSLSHDSAIGSVLFADITFASCDLLIKMFETFREKKM